MINEEAYTEAPRCPFCGASFEDWYNEPDLQGDGSRALLECLSCGKAYIATAYLLTRFSCREIEE